MNRRVFIRNTSIVAGGTALIGGGLIWQSRRPTGDDDAFRQMYELIAPEKNWHSTDLTQFVESLDETERRSLMQALDKRADPIAENILQELRWVSSNIFAYPFIDKADFDYHRLVRWTARNAKVNLSHIESESTFTLESRILASIFQEVWDNLSVEQRIILLNEIDKGGSIMNKAAIASLSGAAALATLSVTVYFVGFAFYATMTTVIFTVAGFVGLTLPFAAYASASTLIAVLAGPVGWAIAAVAAAGGVAMLGRANVQKTTAFVIQIHLLKVKKIMESNLERQFNQYLPDSFVA
jgi:uncharacterized protein YaaW (UPF0174 family)